MTDTEYVDMTTRELYSKLEHHQERGEHYSEIASDHFDRAIYICDVIGERLDEGGE